MNPHKTISNRYFTYAAVAALSLGVSAVVDAAGRGNPYHTADSEIRVDWGTCPCVTAPNMISAPWSAYFGQTKPQVPKENIRLQPFQNLVATSFNDVFDSITGDRIATLDVAITDTKTHTITCDHTAPDNVDVDPMSYIVANAAVALTDCRNGLYELYGLKAPKSPKSFERTMVINEEF